MSTMIWALVKVCVVVGALAAFLTTAPSYADGVAYVSATGGGGICTATQPCSDFGSARGVAAGSGLIECLGAVVDQLATPIIQSNEDINVDCPQGSAPGFQFLGSNSILRIFGMTFKNSTNF